MLFFLIACIALIAAVAAFVLSLRIKETEDMDNYDRNKVQEGKKFMRIVSAVALAFTLIGGLGSTLYSQDVGETVVLKNLGGSIGGSSTDAGFHFKLPWQSVIKYDIRNNVLTFMGETEEDAFEGGSANGSAITINDAGGASATIDIQVNYSLDPEAAEELYANYGTQENFVKSVCAVDIRAIPREVSGQFDTISILTARGEFTSAVEDALIEKWAGYGLIVEQVSIQHVVYPQSIVDKYAEAQAAEIARATAENNQEVARVEAETKIIEAEGEAEANRILANSLTNQVIQQHYIDALKEHSGSVWVVPSDSTPVINTGQ